MTRVTPRWAPRIGTKVLAYRRWFRYFARTLLESQVRWASPFSALCITAQPSEFPDIRRRSAVRRSFPCSCAMASTSAGEHAKPYGNEGLLIGHELRRGVRRRRGNGSDHPVELARTVVMKADGGAVSSAEPATHAPVSADREGEGLGGRASKPGTASWHSHWATMPRGSISTTTDPP